MFFGHPESLTQSPNYEKSPETSKSMPRMVGLLTVHEKVELEKNNLVFVIGNATRIPSTSTA